MDTETLSPDATGFASAASVLQGGGLVSFPTETVYGLGADARQDKAVARIFEAKKPPHFQSVDCACGGCGCDKTLRSL